MTSRKQVVPHSFIPPFGAHSDFRHYLMLCEISDWGNFVITWLTCSLLSLVFVIPTSGTLFYLYYWKPTYESWRYKSNPKFPKPEKIRDEVRMMFKGLGVASICPALTLFLMQHNLSKAYCGLGGHSYMYLLWTFFFAWLFSDFFEFIYHYLGHKITALWIIHKHHHVFANPSPFAVIADEYLDQFVRATPLVILPLLMPINMDVLFLQYALLFYGYGVYLHWGFECEFPDAHHPFINSSFQHYLHHAISVKNKPYHTGFFFKVWDNLFGSVYDGNCFCAKCEQKAGRRTKEQFDKIVKYDYSVLLSPSFWLTQSKETEKMTNEE